MIGKYGTDAPIPADLIERVKREWAWPTATPGTWRSRTAPDGGSYTLTGVRLTGGDMPATLYRDDPGYTIEWSDGSVVTIEQRDGIWFYRNVYSHEERELR